MAHYQIDVQGFRIVSSSEIKNRHNFQYAGINFQIFILNGLILICKKVFGGPELLYQAEFSEYYFQYYDGMVYFVVDSGRPEIVKLSSDGLEVVAYGSKLNRIGREVFVFLNRDNTYVFNTRFGKGFKIPYPTTHIKANGKFLIAVNQDYRAELLEMSTLGLEIIERIPLPDGCWFDSVYVSKKHFVLLINQRMQYAFIYLIFDGSECGVVDNVEAIEQTHEGILIRRIKTDAVLID